MRQFHARHASCLLFLCTAYREPSDTKRISQPRGLSFAERRIEILRDARRLPAIEGRSRALALRRVDDDGGAAITKARRLCLRKKMRVCHVKARTVRPVLSRESPRRSCTRRRNSRAGERGARGYARYTSVFTAQDSRALHGRCVVRLASNR